MFKNQHVYLYSAPVGERSTAIGLSVCLCVCLSVSISLEPLERSSHNFVCRSPVAVARSCSGGVVICHVLPVLWMTWRLAIIGRIAITGVAIPGRSLMSINALCSLHALHSLHSEASSVFFYKVKIFVHSNYEVLVFPPNHCQANQSLPFLGVSPAVWGI